MQEATLLDAETPQYTHDSSCCKFLGRHKGHDLYYCAQGGVPTLLARYGSEGPDYLSGMLFAEPGAYNVPVLTEAKVRARQRGFL